MVDAFTWIWETHAETTAAQDLQKSEAWRTICESGHHFVSIPRQARFEVQAFFVQVRLANPPTSPHLSLTVRIYEGMLRVVLHPAVFRDTRSTSIVAGDPKADDQSWPLMRPGHACKAKDGRRTGLNLKAERGGGAAGRNLARFQGMGFASAESPASAGVPARLVAPHCTCHYISVFLKPCRTVSWCV